MTARQRYDLTARQSARPSAPGPASATTPTPWRYREMLPVRDEAKAVSMGEGMTPLDVPTLAKDGEIPTAPAP